MLEQWRKRFWKYRLYEVLALCISGSIIMIIYPLLDYFIINPPKPLKVFGPGDPQLMAGDVQSFLSIFVQLFVYAPIFAISWYFGFLINYLASYFILPKFYQDFGETALMRFLFEIGFFVAYSVLFLFMIDKYEGSIIKVVTPWVCVLISYLFLFIKMEDVEE